MGKSRLIAFCVLLVSYYFLPCHHPLFLFTLNGRRAGVAKEMMILDFLSSLFSLSIVPDFREEWMGRGERKGVCKGEKRRSEELIMEYVASCTA